MNKFQIGSVMGMCATDDQSTSFPSPMTSSPLPITLMLVTVYHPSHRDACRTAAWQGCVCAHALSQPSSDLTLNAKPEATLSQPCSNCLSNVSTVHIPGPLPLRAPRVPERLDPICNVAHTMLVPRSRASVCGAPAVAVDDQRTEVALWYSLCAHVWHSAGGSAWRSAL